MLALITEAQFEPRTVKVARVIDGDTIQVLSDGRQYTVRLIGADTPETKHPTEAVQRFGQGGQRLYHSGARRPHSAASPDYAKDLNPSEILAPGKSRSPLI